MDAACTFYCEFSVTSQTHNLLVLSACLALSLLHTGALPQEEMVDGSEISHCGDSLNLT